jgi:hypothetical protein
MRFVFLEFLGINTFTWTYDSSWFPVWLVCFCPDGLRVELSIKARMNKQTLYCYNQKVARGINFTFFYIYLSLLNINTEEIDREKNWIYISENNRTGIMKNRFVIFNLLISSYGQGLGLCGINFFGCRSRPNNNKFPFSSPAPGKFLLFGPRSRD